MEQIAKQSNKGGRMKIRESKGGYNTSTVVKENRHIFRTSVIMCTGNYTHIHVFLSAEFDLPCFLQTKKEVHKHIQNVIGNEFQLIISWNFNNKNLKRGI